ncbi:MAG: NADPH:quinone oxidoreductase family protein [Gammaproteobacteria bacterium]|nr:NADPH:quinone oxidoreductase family protein [Gammaproteobacteria bacterium]
MKAIVCTKFAPVEELQFQELPDPVAQSGEVVIDLKACGVNFPDGLLVQGLYQSQPDFPFIPGTEAAGVVSELGEGVTNLKIGNRVIAVARLGMFASKAVVNAHFAFPIPDQIPFEEAAGLVTAHATAHHALKQRANLQPGETLLVTGAAGGTGLAAVQIGKAMGAKVIAVCSTQEKIDLAVANGADESINYVENDLKSEIKRLTDGQGVDVAYEVVGGDAFAAVSRGMAWNGRLLVIGFASGTIPKLPINLALVKGYALVGVFWGAWTQRDPKGFMQNMQELVTWYLQGKVKVHVDEIIALENTANALNKVLNRKTKGKVILRP